MSMASYQELTAQIEKLQKQAAAVRAKEMEGVVAQIHGLMTNYGITGEDLGFKAAAPTKRKGGTVAAKYQDPETGATWTGRGRAPAWIAGKDKSKYAI